jgi:hypothetical protein
LPKGFKDECSILGVQVACGAGSDTVPISNRKTKMAYSFKAFIANYASRFLIHAIHLLDRQGKLGRSTRWLKINETKARSFAKSGNFKPMPDLNRSISGTSSRHVRDDRLQDAAQVFLLFSITKAIAIPRALGRSVCQQT